MGDIYDGVFGSPPPTEAEVREAELVKRNREMAQKIDAYDQALRDSGIEYPLGPQGVRDLGLMASGRAEDLNQCREEVKAWEELYVDGTRIFVRSQIFTVGQLNRISQGLEKVKGKTGSSYQSACIDFFEETLKIVGEDPDVFVRGNPHSQEEP